MPADRDCPDGLAGESSHTPAASQTSSLPHVSIGNHSISRLICGSNPFNAGSHLSAFVDREMRQY